METEVSTHTDTKILAMCVVGPTQRAGWRQRFKSRRVA